MLKIKLFPALSLLSAVLFCSCNNMTENDHPKVIVENGTQADSSIAAEPQKDAGSLGSYVGMFEADGEDSVLQTKNIYAGEAFYWSRENKITMFIDSMSADQVRGHTVIAGNNRPFKGSVHPSDKGFVIEAKEPGTNKEDGSFHFILKDTIIDGTWKAFLKTDIGQRKYTLVKKAFIYNPNQMLADNKRFIDWYKSETSAAEKKRMKAKMSKAEREEYEEFEEDTDFASATKKIYTINASNSLLTENEIANLAKGDLLVIRNSIYARHGYSFRNRPLRVFFDGQPWYMPVNTDIKSAFTEIERKNIVLLLKYEKLAKEFYDYFGRS